MFPNTATHLPTCFKGSIEDDQRPKNPVVSPPRDTSSPESSSNNTDLTTSLFETSAGLISLNWSRSFLGRSLHVQLHAAADKLSPSHQSPDSASFHLHLKHFNFWKKTGSKRLPIVAHEPHPAPSSIQSHLRFYWDFSKAVFVPSHPAPVSDYFIAAVVERELVLLVGDMTKQAISKTKPMKKPYQRDQVLVLKREHVLGNKEYKTSAKINGRNKEITIDCSRNSDGRLKVSVGGEKVLVVKMLKWKFRGNEKVVVDGVPVNISWDVHNWFFQESGADGCAVFMFKFESFCVWEKPAVEDDDEEDGNEIGRCRSKKFGGFRLSRRGKNIERSSSLSSISMSSGSSGGGSSVMEWSSVEENELLSPVGFTLMVHAWRK